MISLVFLLNLKNFTAFAERCSNNTYPESRTKVQKYP